MSPRNPSSATRAPYQVGERVKVMWLEPGAGTVLGTRPVTACTPRADGSGWLLAVAVGADVTKTYFLSPTGHSDYVTRIPKLAETQRARRGHDFYPPPELAATLPAFYATEGDDLEAKVLHAHYFLAPVGDWWVAEYRPETGEAFGYVSLGMPGCAEWGYFALDELERLNTRGMVVERDLHWTPTLAHEANLPD
jgi:hypothetical protein